MGETKEIIMGDKHVHQAGSVMVKFVQYNVGPKQPQEAGQEQEPAAPPTQNPVAACFEEGVMNQEKPHLLFMMLLVLRAKRKWTGQEIPAFYDWVKENYPNLEDYYGKTRDQIVWNMQKLSERATHYFYDKVKDQASLLDFIDELYAKKKDGERRKECIDAQSLAQKLFERL